MNILQIWLANEFANYKVADISYHVNDFGISVGVIMSIDDFKLYAYSRCIDEETISFVISGTGSLTNHRIGDGVIIEAMATWPDDPQFANMVFVRIVKTYKEAK